MRNIIYNFFLLIYGLIQSAVVVMAYVFLSHYYDTYELIFFVIVIVILAVIDKFLRGISGFWPIILCVIVTPIRGIAQLIVFILSIVAYKKKKAHVSVRGGYDDAYFASTFTYVAFGVNCETRGMARDKEHTREVAERRQEKNRLRKQLLTKYPHNFDLEKKINSFFPETIKYSYKYKSKISKSGAQITYNDNYSAMFIEYNVTLVPQLKNFFDDPMRPYYYELCQKEADDIYRKVYAELKTIVDADRSFHGKKYYKVNVKIDG